MKTAVLQLVKSAPRYKAAWNAGQSKGGRINCWAKPREVLRACRTSVKAKHRRSPSVKMDRLAYYLGALLYVRRQFRDARRMGFI